MFSGSSLNLSCEAEGVPSPSFSWTLDNEVIIEASDLGEIIIDSVTSSGELSCKASNSQGEDSRTVELIVVVETSVEDHDRDIAVTKNAGESLKLGCDVNVDPKIANTLSRKWTKDGMEVGDDLLDSEGGVSITYLVSENAGEFICHVATVVDSVTLARHVTVVTEAPLVTEIPDRLGGMEGDSVIIECQVNVMKYCDSQGSKLFLTGRWYSCS